MSEKIYACLLRLYPSAFRDAYGDAALQLFRDRCHDERGFLPRLRLWLDLLSDLAVSVPRQHRYAQPTLIAASAHQDGTPSFHFLERESPRLGALLLGGVLSLGIAGASVSIGRIEHFRPPVVFLPQVHYPQTADVSEQQRVIQAVIANLKQYYIDPEVAQKIGDSLLAHHFDTVPDAAAFAELLTRQMREVSQDRHLVVVYSKDPLPNRPPGPTAEGQARYRKFMEQNNCTFEKVEILPHNIGYLKLNSFPEASVCGPKAAAAMASLNQAGAIIVDLRDNTGGFGNMVAMLAAYLFDHPEYLYNPRENTTEHSWTVSPVAGNRLADKPVYVLTSGKTLSAAEMFCYDLKMLKRVTLVGETTGGSAHAGNFHRIDDHFGMGITETKSINPFSKFDWEGTGVEPDVKVKAADALEKARYLAESRLRN